MKRIVGSLVAAFVGSTVGYVVNQVIEQRSQGHQPDPKQLVVGAPLVTTAVASVVGLVGGRHHRFLAFVAGVGIATFFGDLEAMVPSLKRSAPPSADAA